MQLELFNNREVEQTTNYWLKFFNWQPMVNKLARIDTVIAYCKTLNIQTYCYCMRVKILKFDNEIAVCETTQGWHDATGGKGGNKAGSIWHIKKDDLAPILNNKL